MGAASSSGTEYRIEGLAQASGATVRTIRAYQDRGLLPRPERRGRANVYGDVHLARLRQIAGLLGRGYSLASVKDLLEAWNTGRGLGGVLGLVEVHGPRTDMELRAQIEHTAPLPDAEAVTVALPADTIRSVQRLVGQENIAAFVTAATERELQARTLDGLTTTHRQSSDID
ncbi:MerR family transcriptional regulator [Streptomyces sp. NPDC088400]|uniref:MerR family transcriptional regulator n=1 Tax=Streptomyces sp. NPDC088400 TaxID=3365861 RepID=UPI0037F9C4D4